MKSARYLSSPDKIKYFANSSLVLSAKIPEGKTIPMDELFFLRLIEVSQNAVYKFISP